MPRSKTKGKLQDELYKLAIAAFLEAKRKRDEAKALEEKARKLRAVSAGIDRERPGPEGTLGFRVSESRVKFDCPFRAALMKRGLSVPDWARQQEDPPIAIEVVKSWLKIKTNRPRACPEFWAKKIEKEFQTKIDGKWVSEVPAVDASWPHGIKRG